MGKIGPSPTAQLCGTILLLCFRLGRIGNSTGLYVRETVAALETIGCLAQAAQFEHIVEVAADAGMTHEAIQADRSGVRRYDVTSFSKLHGDKWDAATDEIRNIHSLIDYSEILARAEDYVAIHSGAFRAALGLALADLTDEPQAFRGS